MLLFLLASRWASCGPWYYRIISDIAPKLNVTLPRNTIEVYAELFASGNGDEEAWVRSCKIALEKRRFTIVNI